MPRLIRSWAWALSLAFRPPVDAGSWSARRNFLPAATRNGAMKSATDGVCGMAASAEEEFPQPTKAPRPAATGRHVGGGQISAAGRHRPNDRHDRIVFAG